MLEKLDLPIVDLALILISALNVRIRILTYQRIIYYMCLFPYFLRNAECTEALRERNFTTEKKNAVVGCQEAH